VLDSMSEAHTYFFLRANTYVAELDLCWHEMVPRTTVKATTPAVKATVTKKHVVRQTK